MISGDRGEDFQICQILFCVIVLGFIEKVPSIPNLEFVVRKIDVFLIKKLLLLYVFHFMDCFCKIIKFD